MARPLRLEFPGALYHVTSRGNERRPTFYDDRDRLAFLDFLGEVCARIDRPLRRAMFSCSISGLTSHVSHLRRSRMSHHGPFFAPVES